MVFKLSVLEGRNIGYFVSFNGTGDDMGGPCVGFLVRIITIASEIHAMQLNDSSYSSFKAEM